jgi:hypothetical protein
MTANGLLELLQENHLKNSFDFGCLGELGALVAILGLSSSLHLRGCLKTP